MRLKAKPEIERAPHASVDLGEIDLSAIVKRSAQALKRNRPTAGAQAPERVTPVKRANAQVQTDGLRERNSDRPRTAGRKSTLAPAAQSSAELAYAKGLAQAAGRELSAKKLSQKLRELGFDPMAIELAMARLQQDRVIDDSRFAEVKTRALLRRGKGRRAISVELHEHAISAELIRETLNSIEADWCELAAQARMKRFGGDLPLDAKEYGRQSRFLLQRGYDAGTIRKVLQKQRD